jgi:hypothetical protein
MRKFVGRGLVFAMAIAFTAPILAQDGDLFNFVPPGGRTILADLAKVNVNQSRQLLETIYAQKRDSDGWLDLFKQATGPLSAADKLEEKAKRTLADYLATNMPPATTQPVPDASADDFAKALPPDGRDLTLEHCQSCHIITVVVTQDRTKVAWLGTMNKPSHVEIETTPQQREEIANYLVLNAGIPIDLIPEELRAGGATY